MNSETLKRTLNGIRNGDELSFREFFDFYYERFFRVAHYYVRNNENAVYLDCSQCKSKQRFVRALARQFGVSSTGRYVDVYDDLVFYLNSLSEHTLIVLDEAGDLNYDAFLECKALWNATEGNVGWVKIGAGAESQNRASHKLQESRLCGSASSLWFAVSPSDSLGQRSARGVSADRGSHGIKSQPACK